MHTMSEDRSELLQEWKKLAAQIRKHDKLYERGSPLIGDDYYDLMTARLAWIEGILGPQKNSPIADIRVSKVDVKVPHLSPMLSLDHGFLGESIKAFLKRLQNLAPDPFPIVAEHKVDGIALALRYLDGRLSVALTRGNGTIGNNVTSRIQHLQIPREVDYPGVVEIRGELFMRFSDFEPIKDRFSSPRNACAAFLQNKEPISYMKVAFFPHNVFGLEGESYLRLMESLPGFERFERKLCWNESDCLQFFAETEQLRGNDGSEASITKKNGEEKRISYPIDGVVLKMDRMQEWQQIGFHRTAPRYAFAAKFSPFFKKTTIRELEMQVGKFGTITPVAIFDPIEVDGAVIRRATLHNFEEVCKHGYGIGDEILVSRAGGTIPYVSEKVYDAGNPAHVDFCPSCGRALESFEKTLRCPGSWNCPEQKAERFEHFCSLNAFNISGMGKAVVRSFIEHRFLAYPCDIFELPKHQREILKLEGWSEKSVTNLILGIEKAKDVALPNLIFGLCIPNVGYGNATSLAKHFGTLKNLLLAFCSSSLAESILGSATPLIEIETNSAQELNQKAKELEQTELQKNLIGIGEITIHSIKNFFNSNNQEWVKKLINNIKQKNS